MIRLLFLTITFLFTIYAGVGTDQKKNNTEKNKPVKSPPQHISGMGLLKADEELINTLKSKQAELGKSGGDTSAIESLITLAEEMKELNNKRHIMDDASQNYARATKIFLDEIKSIIQKIQGVITDQANGEMNKLKIAALLQPSGKQNQNIENKNNKDNKDNEEADNEETNDGEGDNEEGNDEEGDNEENNKGAAAA